MGVEQITAKIRIVFVLRNLHFTQSVFGEQTAMHFKSNSVSGERKCPKNFIRFRRYCHENYGYPVTTENAAVK